MVTDFQSQVNPIFRYYEKCLLEQLKTSALKNIKADKNNIIVELPEEDKILSTYPSDVEYPHLNSELINLKLNADLDPMKQLIYGRGLVDCYIGGKKFYAPLFYIPCVITRVGTKVVIKSTGTYQLNMSVIAYLTELDTCTVTVAQILDFLPELPLTDEVLQGENGFLMRLYYILGAKLFKKLNINLSKNFLVLANLGTVTAGMLADYKVLKNIQNPSYFDNTSLANVINGNRSLRGLFSEEDGKTPKDKNVYSARPLTPSQYEAIEVVPHNYITAIQGGPGCGKSYTIAALASDLICKGYRVLIATKTTEALEVLEKKLHLTHNVGIASKYNSFRTDNMALVLGNKAQRIATANRISDASEFSTEYVAHPEEVKAYYNKIVAMFDEKEALERQYALLASKVFKVNILSKFYYSMKAKYVKARLNEINSYTDDRYGIHVDAGRTKCFEELGERLLENTYLAGLNKFVTNSYYRQAVLSYAQMLKSGKNDKFTDVFSKVLECYPLFMTTINDVHQGIPMECGLFDVVIIDEASQCDIAASLPVLLRGQRAVIVGDDKQLKSISFLDRRFNQLALVPLNNSRYSEHVAHLDNGKNSLYDFATYFADNNGIKMLREHFRCTSDNIYFSNKMFYGSKLVEDKDPSDPGELIFVKVQNAEATKKKACNYKEAVCIVNKIVEITEACKQQPVIYPTIGVVTPFRAQAEIIQKMILDRVDPQFVELCKITVGTAHAFQGNEKDIIFISWVVTKNSPVQAYTFINNPNLFNVAITRSRGDVINVCSLEVNDLPENSLLKGYIFYRACRAVAEGEYAYPCSFIYKMFGITIEGTMEV